MNTVIISYILFEPEKTFEDVTYFDFDPETGHIKIIHKEGTFDDILTNVFKITIK